MSKEFDFPIAQVVAEAQYQAVSAQFVTTAQLAGPRMIAAMKLAKIGVMDLNTSAGLPSPARSISHGLSCRSQSEMVATKFFATIKDGRVRGEELAASLGKVMPSPPNWA